MAWLTLALAGCCEVFGVIGLKQVSMRKGLRAWLLLIAAFAGSFSLLSYSMQYIAMGTAYAVWTGIGTVGGALVGMFLYGEPKEWRRVVFIAMILSAAVGLKLIS
ncbi:multidrug efflux SMR transporter [Saccharibacillus sp. CPCC 101409]|uniref:DMT family transporter n=1 Tax=Saccharibacillus sp. CPCC 101409 TaxID=3058041 RepID=UPI0026716654|nr:multidrug efflux SMR transporter [Saccharibacillus sp. CPCC 101409]MDO3412145.1 multidrug efflux SMR transporter [Saccharibacillus sp. CPCC 101409]